MAALAAYAPTRRDAVLEDLDRNQAMPGVDMADVFAVPVAMIVRMFVRFRALLVPPGAPQHPQSDRDDDRGRGELEIGLERLGIHAAPQIQAAQSDAPDHERVRQGRRQSEQNGLRHRSPDRDDEGRHQRLRMTRLKAVQRTEKNGARRKEPCVRGTLLNQLGEGRHGLLTDIW
jgi:hypothetical protein